MSSHHSSFCVPKISAIEAYSNMKVLALVLMAVVSVSCSGSGPYLPSGWKPQGPAFYLPSEVQKPSENPLKDTILNESEASGSDALREYGPPKVVEVSQDLTSQALPETVTEQAFVVIEAKFIEEANGKEDVVEVKAADEVKAEEVTEAIVETVEVTTEQKAVEETVTEIIEEAGQYVPQGRAIDVQAIEETAVAQDATTESVEASTTEGAVVTEAVGATEEIVDSNVESSQVEVSQAQVQGRQAEISQAEVSQEEISQAEVSQSEVSQAEVSQAEVAEVRTVEGVKNVAEALNNLEKEIKAQQGQSSEEAVEVKSVQILGSAEQAPEGFLEYGPPGFKEYGPPLADELVRSAAVREQEPTEEEQKIENNETRRRRFSPKFRSSKKH